MNFRIGNMWSVIDQAQLFLITTNSYVNQSGELVMGRGIALETKTRYPYLPKVAGDWVVNNGFQNKFYGVITDIFNNNIGLFQVKLHFRSSADVSVIRSSSEMLAFIINDRGLTDVHMNYPGIGAGRLERTRVLPILEEYFSHLPITIWEYGS